MKEENNYLYEIKDCFLTKNEMNYIAAILKCLPQGYYIQPQVGLRTIINRTDNAQYQNELNRYVDACIFDINYHPIAVIEINDSSHHQKHRQVRDEKVKKICEEAGLPIIIFWTSYGINPEYITKRIAKAIEESKNPVRIKHSAPDKRQNPDILHIENPPTEQTGTPQKEVYSRKNKKIAILLSAFWGIIGVPFYYIGRPLLGFVATIPFLLFGLIQTSEVISFLNISTELFDAVVWFFIFICGLENTFLAIVFNFGIIKDKYGLTIK